MPSNETPNTPEEMLAVVNARAATRAVKAKEVPPPAPLSETVVLRCEQENFLGDGKIFSHFYEGKFLYVQLLGQWLKWNQHHWTVDMDAHHAKIAVDVVAQEYLRVAYLLDERIKSPEYTQEQKDIYAKEKAALLARAKRCRGRDRAEVLNFAHTGENSLSIEGHELDADPWLLGCANGVIDLRTCEHRAGHPHDYITKACTTDWHGEDADGTPFYNFLQQMLGTQELVDFILRFFGMALLGFQRERKFLVLFGEGGSNGKDTLMNILIDALGQDMCSTIPQEMLMEQSFVADASKPSPHLLALRGKRIVYASETSRKHRFNSERVKDLTGTGEMQARALHTNHAQKWEKSHTLVLLTNELPEAPVHDTAFWDRLLGIELTRRFVDNPDPDKPHLEFPKDPDLRVKMQSCKSGILALLVKGFKDYMQNGLQPPPEARAFGEEYRKKEDVVGQFLEMCCTTSKPPEANNHRTQATTLYECFAWWYALNISKRGNYSNKRFANEMRRKEFGVVKNSVNYYLGVVIKPDVQDIWDKSKGVYPSKKRSNDDDELLL